MCGNSLKKNFSREGLDLLLLGREKVKEEVVSVEDGGCSVS